MFAEEMSSAKVQKERARAHCFIQVSPLGRGKRDVRRFEEAQCLFAAAAVFGVIYSLQ